MAGNITAEKPPETRVPTIWTKLFYGFGSVAYGIKDNGFSYFLLIFFSQALGVDAPLVGLALLIALAVDAVSDPIIGYLSDNTHSRWGRRHPWMYGAAIPIAISYFLIWNPHEGLTGNALFPWIVCFSILIRLLITCYEIPNTALVSELTDDYDQRTSLFSYRYFFGWAGGTFIATFALAVLLVPTETIKSGLINIDGYRLYGMFASALILLSILVTSIGTHSWIPVLKPPPPKQKLRLSRAFKDIFETLANRSFVALFVTTIFAATATGLGAGLYFYLMGYFWGFSTAQISFISFSVIFSALLALVLAPIISNKFGKKRGAIFTAMIAFTAAPMPYLLRFLGVMPENGDPILYPIMAGVVVLDTALIIVVQILAASMVADLAEDAQLRTNRRSEGVLFSAVTFSRKAMQGLGLMTASIVLTIAQFPTEAAPTDVPLDAVARLGGIYAPLIFTIWMLSVISLTFYKINRTVHEQNIETIKSIK